MFGSQVFSEFRKKAGLSENDYKNIFKNKAQWINFAANSNSGNTFFLTPNKSYIFRTISKSEARNLKQILLP